VGDASITWGDAKARLLVATRRAALPGAATDAATERRKVLDQLIDVPIMARRAKEAGLDRDPAYLQRVVELSGTGLVGFHYRQLAEEMAPTEAEVEAYAQSHGETSDLSDERVRHSIERTLIEQSVDAYLDDLQKDGFRVTVDEAKLDRLLAREAERHAAADGAQGQ
jgi:hypothetical protein